MYVYYWTLSVQQKNDIFDRSLVFFQKLKNDTYILLLNITTTCAMKKVL